MHTKTDGLFSYKRFCAVQRRALRIAGPDADFLVKTSAKILSDRLDAVNRTFSLAIDLFSPFQGMTEALQYSAKVKKIIPVKNPALTQDVVNPEIDLSHALFCNTQIPLLSRYAPDLVTSLFTFHRSNEPLAKLFEIYRIMQPDGLFLAVMPGDQTLKELRQSLIEAESELTGAASLRIDPFANIHQYGTLLQNAGFALPVIDREIFVLRYHRLKDLITDLRAMGATACFREKAAHPNRTLFKRTEEILKHNHADEDGKFRISVEMIFLSGWVPHESQQQPLKPGSAKSRLKDFL